MLWFDYSFLSLAGLMMLFMFMGAHIIVREERDLSAYIKALFEDMRWSGHTSSNCGKFMLISDTNTSCRQLGPSRALMQFKYVPLRTRRTVYQTVTVQKLTNQYYFSIIVSFILSFSWCYFYLWTLIPLFVTSAYVFAKWRGTRLPRGCYGVSLNKKEWICSLFKEWILEKSDIRVNLEWTFVLFTHFGVTSGITQGSRVIPEVTPNWVNNTNVHSKFTLISLFSKIHSLKSEHIHSVLFREIRVTSGTYEVVTGFTWRLLEGCNVCPVTRSHVHVLGVKKTCAFFAIVNNFVLPLRMTFKIQIVGVIHSRGVYNFMGINLVP